MAEESWYSTGYDDMKREEDRVASSRGPNRYWMKEGTSRDIVFLDDEPFSIYEHNYRADGSWKNWMTCMRGIRDEAVCDDKLGTNNRSYVGFFTIIDCSEYTDKQGNSYQYEMKLLPAKMRVLKKFKRKKDERGSLIGCMYRVTREDSRSPNVGDEFEFKKEVDLEKLFDYAQFRGKKLKELYEKAANYRSLPPLARSPCRNSAQVALSSLPAVLSGVQTRYCVRWSSGPTASSGSGPGPAPASGATPGQWAIPCTHSRNSGSSSPRWAPRRSQTTGSCPCLPRASRTPTDRTNEPSSTLTLSSNSPGF